MLVYNIARWIMTPTAYIQTIEELPRLPQASPLTQNVANA